MSEGDSDLAGIEGFVGVGMAKGGHYVQAMTVGGQELFDRPVTNDEAAIIKLIADAGLHGRTLYAGSAKTDLRDAWGWQADFARRNADRLCSLVVTDQLLTQLRVLNGRDFDLATDAHPDHQPDS